MLERKSHRDEPIDVSTRPNWDDDPDKAPGDVPTIHDDTLFVSAHLSCGNDRRTHGQPTCSHRRDPQTVGVHHAALWNRQPQGDLTRTTRWNHTRRPRPCERIGCTGTR